MLIKEKNTLVTRHTHRTHSVYINCLPFAKRNFMCHQFVKIIKNLKFYGYHKKVQNENYERILCVQIVRHLLFPVGFLLFLYFIFSCKKCTNMHKIINEILKFLDCHTVQLKCPCGIKVIVS